MEILPGDFTLQEVSNEVIACYKVETQAFYTGKKKKGDRPCRMAGTGEHTETGASGARPCLASNSHRTHM
jgi:hypothetical protein